MPDLRAEEKRDVDSRRGAVASASTVSRELRRNCGLRGYRMKQAQRLSAARRRLASSRPRKLTAELWGWIEGKLRLNWSPQQIAGRLRLEGGPSVGKTWIYRQVWKDRADGGTLHRHLRRRGKKANRRGRRGAGRGVITSLALRWLRVPGRVDIAERPAVVELKRATGRHAWAPQRAVVDRRSSLFFGGCRARSAALGACGRFRAGAHHDGGQRQGGCRGLVGGLFLRPFLGARAERSIFRRRRSSPAWTMPGWNGGTFSMAVRAGFWATARRRKCLARPWTRPDFPARSQSLRRWRGRTRRRGRLDRLAIPSAAFAGGGGVGRARGTARRFSRTATAAKTSSGRRLSPFGLRPRSERRRPNPTGCYAALELRREIAAWQVLHSEWKPRHFIGANPRIFKPAWERGHPRPRRGQDALAPGIEGRMPALFPLSFLVRQTLEAPVQAHADLARIRQVAIHG